MGSVGCTATRAAPTTTSYNLDVNLNVLRRRLVGGTEIDLRASYKPQARIELAAGVDNVTDQQAYQFAPVPRPDVLPGEIRTASR